MRALSCVVVITLMLAPGCCSRLSGGELCGPVTDVTLPVVHADGWAVVEGTIEGRAARILVDSGAGGSFVSATLLGVTPGWERVSELCLGALCIDHVAVWAQDTEVTPADPGPDRVDAVLGTNILQHAVLELDRGDTIRIAFDGVACEGDSVPLSVDEYERPFAPLVIQGVDLGDALVDTGSLYSLLRRGDVSLVGGIGATVPAELCNLERCRPAEVGQATEVCAAGLCETDVAIKTPGGTLFGDSFFNASHYAIDIAERQMTRCR